MSGSFNFACMFITSASSLLRSNLILATAIKEDFFYLVLLRSIPTTKIKINFWFLTLLGGEHKNIMYVYVLAWPWFLFFSYFFLDFSQTWLFIYAPLLLLLFEFRLCRQFVYDFWTISSTEWVYLNIRVNIRIKRWTSKANWIAFLSDRFSLARITKVSFVWMPLEAGILIYIYYPNLTLLVNASATALLKPILV